jgi:hypothetical protein
MSKVGNTYEYQHVQLLLQSPETAPGPFACKTYLQTSSSPQISITQMETPSPTSRFLARGRGHRKQLQWNVDEDVDEIHDKNFDDANLMENVEERNLAPLNEDNIVEVTTVGDVSFTLDRIVVEDVNITGGGGGHNMTREEFEADLDSASGGVSSSDTPFTPMVRRGGSPRFSIFSVTRTPLVATPRRSSVYSANAELEELSPDQRLVLIDPASRGGAFEIFADDEMPTPGISTKRMFGNTEAAAQFFELCVFSISKDSTKVFSRNRRRLTN